MPRWGREILGVCRGGDGKWERMRRFSVKGYFRVGRPVTGVTRRCRQHVTGASRARLPRDTEPCIGNGICKIRIFHLQRVTENNVGLLRDTGHRGDGRFLHELILTLSAYLSRGFPLALETQATSSIR
ncbi:hypothetical protein HAX54_021275, partial [Datura stramonium]|nr:hypothetical protein [Datura stramonium]